MSESEQAQLDADAEAAKRYLAHKDLAKQALREEHHLNRTRNGVINTQIDAISGRGSSASKEFMEGRVAEKQADLDVAQQAVEDQVADSAKWANDNPALVEAAKKDMEAHKPLESLDA